MSDFEEITHRSCREEIFLKIPTKDIPRVNTMKVRFMLVEENTKGEKSFYITNEYLVEAFGTVRTECGQSFGDTH